MNRVFFLLLAGAAILAIACETADTREERNTVQRQKEQFRKSHPAPFFEWSLESHLMTKLYQARNSAVSTWSYVWDPFRGKISWECPSIGFPIPGGTQLTNPEQWVRGGTSGTSIVVLPQAEPNGLFSPQTAMGTYVMCVNPDGTVSPAYVEDNVRTFPQPMQEIDGKLVPIAAPNLPSISTQSPNSTALRTTKKFPSTICRVAVTGEQINNRGEFHILPNFSTN